MVVFPNAKINLGLFVTSKRDDGFHDIETCFVPIGLTDILEFIESEKSTSFVSSGLPIPGESAINLCVMAWKLLHNEFSIPPVKIHLHKQIPIGAGLGGGSSDAAYMLKGLNEYFKLQLSVTAIKEFAEKLGSDCAFFVENKTSFAQGRGEILTQVDINLKALKMVLINPGIPVSTKEAYAGIIPQKPTVGLKKLLELPMVDWKEKITNDFEKVVFKKHPEIASIKAKLLAHGAVLSLMTGSGSSVFGLFKERVPENLRNEFPDQFVWFEE
jgi:4-diphosphocytidyl-2-C-methyl-D-erythritol kinase